MEIIAGAVTLRDRRVARESRVLCLALYSGDSRLAILAKEAAPGGEDPSWLRREELEAALRGELNAAGALNLWEKMTALLPGASRFVLEDLLPHCRRQLLGALVEELYDDIKTHAMNIFHCHQNLMMLNRSSGQSLSWMERFLFRVMGEAELKRLFAPAEFDRPVNLPALTGLMNKRGLVGLAKEEPMLAEAGQMFLDKVFHSLREGQSAHFKTLLTELTGFLKLIRDENFNLDLWGSQNQWHSLRADAAFMARLGAEERGLMDELGRGLGFSADFLIPQS
jgi:hypothetical protein